MKIRQWTHALLGASILISGNSFADRAVLIGGGYNLHASQGQIELNVKWVQEVLKARGLPVVTFYTDGNEPTPDVHYQIDPSNIADNEFEISARKLEPLARVFGNHYLNNQRYRNHTVDDVSGSTRTNDLKLALTELLSAAPDEGTLLVYNGHGKQSPGAPENVSLELWDDTKMTAKEFHDILNTHQAPVRFVFTQCYSGGFHRLAYKNPERGLALTDTPRCGFTAESAYRMSEGCSASIDTDDYRDYTTYFFAALSGNERDGEAIGSDPDTNADGQITLREAHLFTLAEAHSTDLSRSTSEDFLMRWEPWYLKWLSAERNVPDNEYAVLYREVADRLSMPPGDSSVDHIRTKFKEYAQQREALLQKRQDLRGEEKSIQSALQAAAFNQWPELKGPYTAYFEQLAVDNKLGIVADWLGKQDSYDRLMTAQKDDFQLDAELLIVERNEAQMQKLLHFRKLARLKQQLYAYGSETDITAYDSLLLCEDFSLQ